MISRVKLKAPCWTPADFVKALRWLERSFGGIWYMVANTPHTMTFLRMRG